MNLSSNSGRKVTKRTPPRQVCPSGPRGIRLCQRAVLTRRPGSTGLNSTSLSNFPYQSRMPRQTSRGEYATNQVHRILPESTEGIA
jgi:hypothetical protein